MSCRKRGQHCSFLDDPTQERGPPTATGASPSDARGLNDMESSVSDAFMLDSAEAFKVLTAEDPVDKDSGDGYLQHNLSHGGFINPDNMELSTILEGLTDSRGWSDSAGMVPPTPQQMPTGLDTMGFDLEGITSNAMQPLYQRVFDMDDPMGSSPVVSQNSGPVSNTSSPMQTTEVGHRPGAITPATSPKHPSHGPNSIDQRANFQSTYFGLSGESDPYLLRHYLYNEADEFPFLQVIYRRTQTDYHGSDGLYQPSSITQNEQNSHVPVQFLLTSNELGEELKKIGPVNQPYNQESVKSELDALVNNEHGRRLVLL